MKLKSIFQTLFKGKAEDEYATTGKQREGITDQQAREEQRTDIEGEIDYSGELLMKNCALLAQCEGLIVL